MRTFFRLHAIESIAASWLIADIPDAEALPELQLVYLPSSSPFPHCSLLDYFRSEAVSPVILR
jgi:hypothetical protein